MPGPIPSTTPPPRLSNVLALAHMVALDPTAPPLERKVAAYLVSLFGGPAIPGLPEPEVYCSEVILTREMVGIWRPHEAIALARSLIVGAEISREKP